MKHFLKWLGLAALALVLLYLAYIVGIFGWQKWTGIKKWKQVQAELRSKGEKLTFAELVPPPPTDSENFFADPMWQQLADLVPHSDHGKTSWIIRIPKKDLIINQWNTPLSDSELDRIKPFFSEGWDSKSLTRKDAIKLLGKKLLKVSENERPQMAQAILDLEIPADPMLSRITELSKRSSAYFPIRYQDGVHTSLNHILQLMALSDLLGARSTAELALGDTTTSAKDIQTLLRLSTVVRDEPILICSMVGQSLLKSAIDPLSQGIEQHRWSEEELKGFQESPLRIDLLEPLLLALHGERACVDENTDLDLPEIMGQGSHSSWIMICGWFVFQEHQKAFYDQWIQDFIDAIKRHDKEGVNKSTLPEKVDGVEESKDLTGEHKILKTIVARMADGGIRAAIHKTVENQTFVSQTLIACALERYRLAHGAYPASLDVLVPEYLAAIPKEPTTGQPMHYRLLADGKFLLWAPAWNLQTLDGKPGEYKDEGDIVWNQPLASKERVNPR